MKKLVSLIGLVGAGFAANNACAQVTPASATPSCVLDADELAKAPMGSELLAKQASLVAQKQVMVRSLEAVPAGDAAGRKSLENRIELNRIALSYVQKALASFAKRQESMAECESALNRWALVNRIAVSQDSAADQLVALGVEAASVTAYLGAARAANGDLIKVGPSAAAYTKLSLLGLDIRPAPGQAPSRQADARGAGGRSAPAQGDHCESMIYDPAANLKAGGCGSGARIRSARSYGGGDVAFPSSVLRPRGLTANLAGSSSDGAVAITYADSFKFRRTPRTLPDNLDDRVQLPWEFGYSFSVKAKDGLIFSRDDRDKRIKDTIDAKATVSGGLFFNVYEGETLREWNDRAAKLKDAAIQACRKEQAGGDSKAPSTCAGQSLTDWVFAVKPEDGALLHPDLAKAADALYFGSKDKPLWGGGINVSLSRSNYEFLDPAVFNADTTAKNQSAGDWNYTATVFGFKRLIPVSSEWDVSFIPSVSRSWTFGYREGTKPKQFCPALTSGTPFVTGSCPSYYTAAPHRIVSWTKAAELRILTPRSGPLPSFGISPKFSHENIVGSTADRSRLVLPALAFVDKEAGLGVGLEYSREWGGSSDVASPDGTFEKLKREDALKIIVTKSFSLTDF